MAKCPICQTEYQEDSQSQCITCGWDLASISYFVNTPQAFENRDRNHLQWAKERWLQHLSQQQDNKQQLEQFNSTVDELKMHYSEVQEQLGSTQFKLNNYESQVRGRGIQRTILLIILALMTISSGAIGYWGYKEISSHSEELSLTQQALEKTKEELETNEQELDTTKGDLDRKNKDLTTVKTELDEKNKQIQELNRSKQALENELSNIKEYYQNYLNNHEILKKGSSLNWNGTLSSNNRTMLTNPIILDQDSYLDITLSNLTEEADANFVIVNSNGNYIYNSQQTEVGEDSLSNFSLSKGSYQIRVWLVGSESTTYTLKVNRRNK